MPDQDGDKPDASTWRPHARIKAINFRDGSKLELGEREIVVVVGPNNAGKSLLLRELNNKIAGSTDKTILVQSVELQLDGTQDEVKEWARSVTRNGSVVLPYGQVSPDLVGVSWGSAQQGAGLGHLKSLIAIHLSTERRLLAADSEQNINLSFQMPTTPLQHLYDKDELEERLSNQLKRAFGKDLIVNRGAGREIVLHFGDKPAALGGDRGSKAYRNAVNALPMVQTQGDGIRAFVGVLLHTFVIDHDVMLIDEPDAFLHPPQAAVLGRMLATELPERRQIVAATHSSDFLRGILDAQSPQVRVVRLRRDADRPVIRELAPEKVMQLWRDPLLRFSNIFDGLFHDGVIVCEADGDCRFYGAMMDALADGHRPDLLLTYSGGKQRTPTIIRALRAIDVPVRAVLDFDVLRNAEELRTIYEALGGTWEDIEKDHNIVKASVDQKRPELSTEDVRKRITAALERLDHPAKTHVLPSSVAEEISAAIRRASPWSEAKRIGKVFVPSGEATQAYERLAHKMRDTGLYLVEVGELEQFCKAVPAHGPAWVIEALNRDLKNAPELEEARKFARSLLINW